MRKKNEGAKTDTALPAKKEAPAQNNNKQPAKNQPAKNNNGKKQGNGKVEVGDHVTFANGSYTADSSGTGASGSSNRGKKVYITKIQKQKVKEADCPMYAYTPEQFEAVIKWNIQNCLANGLQPVIYMTSITDDAAEIEAEAHPLKLASLTGMRVGEIVALKWEDIHNEKGYFTIQRSEKFNRKTKEYFIDKTKNKKVRNFPLDEKITTLFTRVKKAEFAKGYLCEWIFANEEGRIHAPVVSSCIKNKCKQLRIPDRGIHAFRKTFNSNMRCAGVSEVVAASLLGHSPDVNKNYYTFDTTSLEDKAKIVADAHAHFG